MVCMLGVETISCGTAAWISLAVFAGMMSPFLLILLSELLLEWLMPMPDYRYLDCSIVPDQSGFWGHHHGDD